MSAVMVNYLEEEVTDLALLRSDRQLMEAAHEVMNKFFDLTPSFSDVQELLEYVEPDEAEVSGLMLWDSLANGLYSRAMSLPGGVIAGGKKHRKGGAVALLQGELTIVTEQGTERVVAPRFWNDEPGVQRVAYAHKDSVIVTVHATEETTPQGILEDIFDTTDGAPLIILGEEV